jgi:DNA-binding Lrp family transcriptional regulator
MRLSPKEMAILASAELRVDAPIEVLRKDAGYREHTVRYALRRLLERKVIEPIPFINLHRLGYTVYTVLFSAAASERKGSKSLLESLLEAPYVLWVGEFGGEYQYGIGFCCRRFPELVLYLRELSRKYQQLFFDKVISLQISSTIYPRRYLWQRPLQIAPLTSTFNKQEVVEIDRIDERILSALTTYSLLSHRQIALKLGMPLSSFELRVRKLREQGVLLANVYGFDSRAVGRESYKLLVYTKGLDSSFSAEMHKFCLAQPDVVSLIDCLGVWGYEIGVEVTHGQQVNKITQDLYDAFPNLITTVRPLTKFRYPKVRFFPEIS